MSSSLSLMGVRLCVKSRFAGKLAIATSPHWHSTFVLCREVGIGMGGGDGKVGSGGDGGRVEARWAGGWAGG